MTKQLFTVFDTDFDLSDLDDCNAFVAALEAFGKIHTWKLYDLLCEVDQIQGNEEEYHQFLNIIAEKFGQTIDTERELCTDDAAAKTILTTFSSAIDQYFRSNGTQPFVIGFDATPFVGEEVEYFTLEGFGTANEEKILQNESHLVTRVLEPVRDTKTGLTRIGNIGNFSVQVYTVNIKGRVTAQFGLQHPDPDAVITDEIQEIAKNLFDIFMSRQEAA